MPCIFPLKDSRHIAERWFVRDESLGRALCANHGLEGAPAFELVFGEGVSVWGR